MKIRIKLFADFAEKMPAEQDAEGAAEITLPEGTSIYDVLDRFEIPYEEAYIVLLDGRHAKKSVVIPEGAELCVFPPIVGG
ncbi:MAG: MoaD/ThiS family protein [Nitrospinae bacterium]|nr:MoaD/ThiS family protein [Nitrospinota bacterium]